MATGNRATGASGTAKPRARLRGQTQLQVDQRVATRTSILAAARAVFFEKSYAATTTNDLVERAGISRTAFYRHFDSKWAVARAFQEELLALCDGIWERIADASNGSEADIAAAMQAGVDVLHDNKPLLALLSEVAAIEQQAFTAGLENFDHLVGILAAQVPAYRFAASPDPSHMEAWVWGRLVMTHYWQVAGVIVRHDAWDGARRSIAIGLLAREYRDFVRSWKDGPPTRDKAAAAPAAVRRR